MAKTNPYPNEHAARIHSPRGYVKFRRQNNFFGRGIHVIWGIKRNKKVEIQAIRFSTDRFPYIQMVRDWLYRTSRKAIKLEPAVTTINQRSRRMPIQIPGTYQKSYSWQSPDGSEKGTFRKNPGEPKFAYKEGAKCYDVRVNPVKWTAGKMTFSANLFVGLSVKSEPMYHMDDLVSLVKKVRKKQVKHPDSSFVYQKGVYTHEHGGSVVTEDAAQVILFNVPPMQKNFSVFRAHMIRLAEIICKEMKQETVILRIDKNGVTEETMGIRA